MRMKMQLHPRAWIDALLTYPRFLGSIKPELMGASAGQIGTVECDAANPGVINAVHGEHGSAVRSDPFENRVCGIFPQNGGELAFVVTEFTRYFVRARWDVEHVSVGAA